MLGGIFGGLIDNLGHFPYKEQIGRAVAAGERGRRSFAIVVVSVAR